MSAFDLNSIINAAISAAVNERMMEIQQQHLNAIGELAGKVAALQTKLEAAEAKLAGASSAAPTAQTLAALNDVEWFWDKLYNYIERQQEPLEKAMAERLQEKLQEYARSAAEEAITDHCESYDHDDYDNTSSTVSELPDMDDMLTLDTLREEIEEVLNNATLSIRR